MARTWRVHVIPAVAEPGSTVDLETGEAHHVAKVLRLRPGAAVAAFDGVGREWDAELVSCDEERVAVRLGAERTAPAVEPPIPVTLFQGLCRPERMEWVVQKAVEIGASSIRPFDAERSGPWRISENRLRRWRSIALEACKQSGRRRIPDVEPVDRLPAPDADVAILLDTGKDTAGLGAILSRANPGEVWIAVGPEGGFSDQEIVAHLGAGWTPASLGPRTMRTETAGIAAAAIVLHRWGDLGS